VKVDFDAVIKDMDGVPIPDARRTEGEPRVLTLKAVCVNGLLATETDKNVSGQEKLRRFNLAQRVNAGGEQNLSAEDVTLIKDRVGAFYVTLVVGRAFALLDGS
jgi:hypothetical protein